ncbi:acetate kinase [Microbulbifer agarilyticus]|uniref:acetate kinase n=1 Tax=Microbulbifer agarilyticus TaxID=260552 RepID=UPI001CD62801|nr:acetate kinase [Microbulbifer agarilyticus]MCA0891875.1 acetate kinase [Microbulbifer agarilyticus]
MPDKRANGGQVLVLNCGSSSLKFALIDPRNGNASLSGLGDSLGHSAPSVSWKIDGEKHSAALPEGAKHTEVIEFVVTNILSGGGILRADIAAIGHRVVHGGEKFSHSVLINEQVISAIQDCVALAPLHNPAHLQGIEAATKAFPGLPQVAVFDTAFHQTMPRQAYIYALPYELYEEHGIRRYGMHGTSHRFVSERAADLLGKAKADVNIISAHLGNGASIAAIQAGKSVDTSMGLTPLEGLVMGTRCGDVDPGLLLHLGVRLDYCMKEINDLLNKKSGLLGISQLSNDCRALEQAAAEGHQGAQLALEIFCYRLAKYIASYHGVLSHVDALVFTGGIGENSAYIRENVLNRLIGLGYRVDETRNLEMRFGAEGAIEPPSGTTSTPKVLVIPTNEEWVIARDAAQIIASGNSAASGQPAGGS